ncbi:MAG: nucleotidyltransferase domain-containing protein [Bacteroidota bacterium]
MPRIISDKLSGLKSLCRRHKVKYLYVFGSVLTDDFGDDSDIDFLYDLEEESISGKEYLRNLDKLISGLLEAFPGRKVDLVHYPSIRNPYLLHSIDTTKTLLYAQRPEEVSI